MTTLTNDQRIASEIIKQLGGQKALFMMGAKNMACGPNLLTMKIRGSKFCNHLRIKLNSMDTYDIDFIKVRGMDIKTVETAEGIYNDGLVQAIESRTGLYLSL